MKTGIKNLSFFLKRKTNVLGRKKMRVKYLDLSDTWHRKTGWQCIWIASLWEIWNQCNSNWTKYNLVIEKAVYTWWQGVPLCERSHCVRGGVVADKMLGLKENTQRSIWVSKLFPNEMFSLLSIDILFFVLGYKVEAFNIQDVKSKLQRCSWNMPRFYWRVD